MLETYGETVKNVYLYTYTFALSMIDMIRTVVFSFFTNETRWLSYNRLERSKI